MNSKITDIIVHTRELLNDIQFLSLTRRIYKNDGIVSVSRNVHTPRMLMIVYNAARTHSSNILGTFRELGYNAALVGM
jgi:hypothetical protein